MQVMQQLTLSLVVNHLDQGILGALALIDIVWQTGIGMTEVHDKVHTHSNQNRKTDRFQKSKLHAMAAKVAVTDVKT
jgi:hypothetical protein